jgi:alkaline phosphatase
MTEAAYWRQRCEMMMATFTETFKSAIETHTAPCLLADAESFNAGKAMAFNEATYAIGIDTAEEGVHTVVVYRMVPGQPSTLVASQRLPAATP